MSEMRLVKKIVKGVTKVTCHEKAHHYTVDKLDGEILDSVVFQKGAIQEVGVNGIQIEDLLTICIDRLQIFQTGDFKCKENACAITHLEEARMWLDNRTLDRQSRQVEGTNNL